MQFEDLGFCDKGEGPAFVRAHTLTHDGELPEQHQRRPALGRAGRRGRRLPRHDRGDPPAHRRGRRARRARTPSSAWSPASAWSPTTAACAPARSSSGGRRHDHAADEAAPRKNPVLRTRQMNLPPWARGRIGARHDGGRGRGPLRAAGLRATAAPCSTRRARPATAACRRAEVAPQAGEGELLSETVLHHSNDLFFRERLPWRLGLVRLDAGPTVIVHLHGDVAAAATAAPAEPQARARPRRRAPRPRRRSGADRISRPRRANTWPTTRCCAR